MFCAFRMSGHFIWPPHPETLSSERRKGTVEIHFAQKGDGKPFEAWLRWVPLGAPVGPEAPELPGDGAEDNVYTASDPVGRLGNGMLEVKIWLSALHGGAARTKLVFRGGARLEQPSFGNEQQALCLPLVPECRFKETGPSAHSELVIGQNGNDNVRFDLLVPTPFPQTARHARGDTQPNPSAFAFSAIYASSCADLADAQRIQVLVCGAGKPGFGSFQLHSTRYPQTRRLGAFAFSAGGAPHPDFVVYRGRQMRGGDEIDIGNTALGSYWPRDPGGSVRVIFKNLGVDIEGDAFARFPDALGDLSIRFGGTVDKPHILYRITLQTPSNRGMAGDLRWEGGRYRLRLRQALSGNWLETGAERLHLDITTVFEQDGDADGGMVWKRAIGAGLSWDQTLSGTDGLATGQNPIFTGGLLPAANRASLQLLGSLQSIEGGLPQSFLPQWLIPAGATARFVIRSALMPSVSDDGNVAIFGYRGLPGERQPPLRLSLADADITHPDASVLAVTTQLPGFLAQPEVVLKWQFAPDAAWMGRDQGEDWSNDGAFASFRIEPVSGGGKAGLQGRLSSVQFTGSVETFLEQSGEFQFNTLKLGAGCSTGLSRAGFPGVGIAPLTSMEFRLRLRFASIDPVTVDIDRSDRTGRPAPLLIALRKPGLDHQVQAFYLDVRERIALGEDRLLKADLYENDQGVDRPMVDYMVLSEQPFSISRFSVKRLGDRGDAGNQLVATYSSDERVWNVRQVAEYYHYRLPPQGVAEGMDKPHRLEIHDLSDRDADANLPVPRPYVSRHGVDGPAAAALGDLQRRAVEFRLTPSAEFWIRPSDVERGYFLPEWTSYEIFRQRGALGLGAALRGLRAEFLYGLSVGIDPTLEKGRARFARIAEVEALTGRIAGPYDSEAPFAQRWAALSHAIARRPERLEVWADDPDADVAFAPARFGDGVSFSLRPTALHRAPLKTIDASASPLAKPVSILKGAPRHHPQGLSGGALWPVEQANLFRKLTEMPESSGGEIEGVALSALGGDATQKAVFLDGLVSIISKTEGGFVSRLQVEVKGRIAAFWHRAKHVVVYERTVSASPQFAPKRQDDPDGTRTRRPVLRKVREYVELLEPERRYPDFPQATARTSGFLDRVRFNSKIINVDSAWSRDVGEDGWIVPLWNRKSAKERPQVYAQPDISFVTMSEGDGEAPVVAQECLEPDRLHFFSEFKSGTDDSDLWKVRKGIDACTLDPAAIAAEIETRKSRSPDTGSRRRNASRILPGLRGFTWRLAPAGQKTAINAGRAAKPVYAGLESVTFMRVAAIEALTEGQVAALAGQAAVARLGSTVVGGIGYWQGTGKGGPAGAGAFSEIVAGLQAAVGKKPLGDVVTLKDKLESLWSGADGHSPLPQALKQSLASGLAGVASLHDAVANFPPLSRPGGSVCDALGADAIAGLKRKNLLVVENLRSFEADTHKVLQALVGHIEAWLEEKKKSESAILFTRDVLIDRLCDDLVALLRPLFQEASFDVAGVGEGMAKAIAIAGDVEAEASAVLSRAAKRVGDVAKAWDRDKPWSPSRMTAFETQMRTAANGVFSDLQAAVDEARQRLAVEIGEAQESVAAQLAKALTNVIDRQKAASGGLCSHGRFLTKHLENLDDAIEALLDPKSGLIVRIRAAIDGATETIDKADIDETEKQAAKALLDRARNSLQDIEVRCAGVVSVTTRLKEEAGLKAHRAPSWRSPIRT